MADSFAGPLLRQLAAAARRGEPCPSNRELAAALGLGMPQQVQWRLRAAEAAGLITIRRLRTRPFRVVAAADGSWATAEAAPPAPALAPRRCLNCRRPFRPEHRHRFLCDPCGARNSRVAL
ncbi:hypothetical protein GCM10010964_18430 [Caldovatus sediminis]|uniref:LexA repressor DNA-binding domain-containing protein n=1 Tax=Caldovatus sediminis TaxID=2041189 RepID=A0A8J2ZBJ7_9PROT|nr:Lrp/AsnC family transcriptional regulator [Caldovatus sediminis]GGG30832.1 hypothetical protein GCM10010964_18430 [Caldovatus sediminis]